MLFTLKSLAQIECLRATGQALEFAMNKLEKGLLDGTFKTPVQLNEAFCSIAKALGSGFGTPFVNVAGKDKGVYGSATCISVNDEIVHSRPANREFREGDIIKVDAGLSYSGLNADIARTFRYKNPTGTEYLQQGDPIRHTNEILERAIEKCRPWGRVEEISSAIFQNATARGMFVILDFTGHGIGTEVHEEPIIPQFPVPGFGSVIIRPGMALCVEVILANKETKCVLGEDGWCVLTSNGAIAYHREAMVLVKDHSVEVISQ